MEPLSTVSLTLFIHLISPSAPPLSPPLSLPCRYPSLPVLSLRAFSSEYDLQQFFFGSPEVREEGVGGGGGA